jgi:hypothetical protein
MNIKQDIARCLELEQELSEMNRRIGEMVPDAPALYDPMQMAYIYSAQAAEGCKRTARYLKEAVRKALEG